MVACSLLVSTGGRPFQTEQMLGLCCQPVAAETAVGACTAGQCGDAFL